MGGLRWERWAPASGIVYVVLLIVTFVVSPDDIGETDEEVLARYADSGDRAGEIAAFFLGVVAILFFLLFVNTLRNRLRSVEAEPKGLSALAFGAGIASAVLFIGALALFVGMSVAAESRDEFVVDPNLARFAEDTGFLLFAASIMVMSLLVAATSVLALRTAVLPMWLGWVGLLVAVALLFGIFFFPFFVAWLWVLVVSVVLIVRGPTSDLQEAGPEAT